MHLYLVVETIKQVMLNLLVMEMEGLDGLIPVVEAAVVLVIILLLKVDQDLLQLHIPLSNYK